MKRMNGKGRNRKRRRRTRKVAGLVARGLHVIMRSCKRKNSKRKSSTRTGRGKRVSVIKERSISRMR